MIDLEIEKIKEELELVVLKLSSGEEVFANVIDRFDDIILVEYALLIKIVDDEYFYCSLFNNKTDAFVEINKNHVVASSEPDNTMSLIFLNIITKELLENPMI